MFARQYLKQENADVVVIWYRLFAINKTLLFLYYGRHKLWNKSRNETLVVPSVYPICHTFFVGVVISTYQVPTALAKSKKKKY